MKPVFSKPARIVLLMVGAVSTIAILVWFFFGHQLEVVRSAGPDSFSLSALGHHGLTQVLENEGYTVHVSRAATELKAKNAGLLVLAEPRIDPDDQEQVEELRDLIHSAQRVLLVLPKRRALADPRNPAWVSSVTNAEHEYVRAVLNTVLPSANVAHPETLSWNDGERASPRLTDPQLISEAKLGTPLIHAREGEFFTRLGYEDDSTVWILSDPDLIANHGLDEPGNLELIRQLFAEMTASGGGIVIDETFHGHEASPSIGKLLTEFPLVITTIQAILVLLLLAWALLLEMGATRVAEFEMKRGKMLMLRNTAELMRFGGHDASATERYVMALLDEVARRLRAPGHLSGIEKARWLDARAEERGVAPRAHDFYARAQRATIDRREYNPRQLLALARATQNWKMEMLDGA